MRSTNILHFLTVLDRLKIFYKVNITVEKRKAFDNFNRKPNNFHSIIYSFDAIN